MPAEIRKILSEYDLKSFLPVIKNSFLTVAEELKITEETAPSNPAFLNLTKLTDIYLKIKCFGLYYQNLPAGFFGLEKSKNSSLIIEKLAVLPEFRHRGYGKMILDYSKDFAYKNNFTKLSIAIIDENKRLKEWYRNYGFVEVNTTHFPHLPFKVCFMEFSSDSADN